MNDYASGRFVRLQHPPDRPPVEPPGPEKPPVEPPEPGEPPVKPPGPGDPPVEPPDPGRPPMKPPEPDEPPRKAQDIRMRYNMPDRTTRIHASLPGVLFFASFMLITSAGATPADDTAPPTEPAETIDMQTVQKDWAEALASLKQYSAAQRDQAMIEAEAMLRNMDDQIEALEARAREEWTELSDSARQQRQATLHGLRQQRSELAEWYGGMKHSSADAWSSVKQGFIEAYGTLRDSFSEARTEFYDSEQPSQ
ncbi:MAG: hypothetical protein RQ736_08540 [Thiogranum sp.]|nr:hypothetical protein [Thiogranum sp.]